MSYQVTAIRKGSAKLAVVEPRAEDEQPEGVLGDGDGEDEWSEIDAPAVRVICLECATSCLSSDPTLGDPLDLARRMYEFVLEG